MRRTDLIIIITLLEIIILGTLWGCQNPKVEEPIYFIGETGTTNYELSATLIPTELIFPVNLSSLNFSLLSNMSAFMTQTITDANVSAYEQDSDTPCYTLENTGEGNLTVKVRVSSYNSTYRIMITEGFNNKSATPRLYLNASYQDFVNLSVWQINAEEELNFFWNKTTNTSKDRLVSLTLYNSTRETVSTSDYSINLTTGEIIITNDSLPYDEERNKSAEEVVIRANKTIYLDHGSIKTGTLVLYLAGTILNSSLYTADLNEGTFNYTAGDYENDLVYVNYTYRTDFDLTANYTYWTGELKNASCFGSRTSAILNNSFNTTIEWSYTGI